MATPKTNLIDFQTRSVDTLLERKVERYLHLKEAQKELDALRQELKSVFQDETETRVGRFVVKGKWIDRKETRIPACRFWDMRISPAV